MRIVITGTPGTGKTQAGKLLAHNLKTKAIDANEFVREKGLYTEIEEGSFVVDLEKFKAVIEKEENFVATGHILSEISLDVDYVFILRTNPRILEIRLQEKKWKKEKIKDNIEAEALDYCTQKVLENYSTKNIHEIDSTHLTIKEIVDEILNIVENNLAPNYGFIDWSYYFLS